MRQRAVTPEQEERFFSGVTVADDFFGTDGAVHRGLEDLTRVLEADDIPFAFMGGLALYAYGHRRVTPDLDMLLTRDAFEHFKARDGYLGEAKGLRDIKNNVRINVALTGEYPGDAKPKAVSYPDPALAARGMRVRIPSIETLVELKLASGISAPHRLIDLADVLELIQDVHLPADFADRLDESVRPKFVELWQAAQTTDP
jgi:hypothetical protein